jgi:acyl-CoA thioester hydrolase
LEYPHFVTISTRWMDNDVYGHVNNVVYYSFFDTAVNQFLIEKGVLDIAQGGVIGLVVQSACEYFAPLRFPGLVEAGLRVAATSRSSVHYEIGLFAPGSERTAARGRFVHVYVDRATRRPHALPPELRSALASLQRPMRASEGPSATQAVVERARSGGESWGG